MGWTVRALDCVAIGTGSFTLCSNKIYCSVLSASEGPEVWRDTCRRCRCPRGNEHV